MYTAAGGTSADPTIPSGYTAGPGPAPLRAERPPLPQGLISVSEVEAKSPGAQCRIQIRTICTSWGEAPHENLRRVSDEGEPTTERVVCIHTIKRDHVTRVPCEIFITIHEPTHPSPPNSHVLCVEKTLKTYSPDKFPACSNRTGLTTVSMLRIPPQDAFILQFKICSV